MGLRAALAGAIFIVALPVSARADGDDGLRLTWTAPPECPSSATVRAAILRDAQPRRAPSEPLDADARVEQKASTDGWRVRLRTRQGAQAGEREIEAATCGALADATAVILALALAPPGADAASASAAPGDAPAPPASATPGSAPPEDEGAAPAARRDRRGTSNGSARERQVALGVSAAGDASSLPAPTLGGSLTLAWTPGRFRVELDARRWISQAGSVPSSNAGARFSMTSIGGRGCWTALKAGLVDLAPCAGADGHIVAASGYGADANFAAGAEWTTVAGGALARLSLTTWLALRARGEAIVPLARPTFVVENDGPVHRPPTLGAAASLGAELLFL